MLKAGSDAPRPGAIQRLTLARGQITSVSVLDNTLLLCEIFSNQSAWSKLPEQQPTRTLNGFMRNARSWHGQLVPLC